MSTPLIDPSSQSGSTGTFDGPEHVPDEKAPSKPSSQASGCWFQKEEMKEYRSSILVSFILLLVGAGLLFAGIVLEIGTKDHAPGTICIVVGVLMFIPGLYYTGYAYFCSKGFQGFDVNHLKYFKLSK